jgi:phospholipid/cholesterol/gamma-HCH transport system substrate-binding protein
VAVKLGLFTVVTIVVTIGLAAVIGNLRLGSNPYVVTAEFSDASGVLQGDVVKAAGVTIGRVQEIRVEDGIAKVDLSIDENIQLPAGMSVAIEFRNLVGQRMVSFFGDGDPAESLGNGDVIPLAQTKPAFDLTALFNGLRPLIRSTTPADINVVSREVYAALKGRSADLEGFLSNVAEVSEMIGTKDAQLSELLDGFNLVTADLAGRGDQLNNTLGSMNHFLTQLASDGESLDAALVTLDDASTRLHRIVANNDERIAASVDDLAILLDAVDDKRGDLRAALRALPDMLLSVERANSYGQWSNIHLINACKDDLGTCGTRWSQ